MICMSMPLISIRKLKYVQKCYLPNQETGYCIFKVFMGKIKLFYNSQLCLAIYLHICVHRHVDITDKVL